MLLLLACAEPVPDSGSDPDPYLDPGTPGPYQAGTFEDELQTEDGALTVQAWFPGEGGSSTVEYDDFLEGGAFDDAAPACDGPRPVVVFSHGNSGVRYQSIFLTEHLASRGWIVVAPDHRGNTFYDEGTEDHASLILRRPADIAATFDWLVNEAAADGGPLAGCVDPDGGYAAVGHSFGGYTTFAVSGATIDVAASAEYCSTRAEWLCPELPTVAGDETSFDLGDDRVWAAVPMSPAGYEVLLGGLDDLTVPTMVLSGTLDTLTPMETQVRPYFEGLSTEPRVLGELTDAGHFTFSDACAMAPTFDDCDPPYLSADEAHPLIVAATTAFLEWTAGDDRARDHVPTPDEPAWTWTQAP